MMVIKKSSEKSLFERLNSLHKLLICFGIALLVYLLIQIDHLDVLTHLMIGWDTFCLFMIVISFITFSVTRSQQIRELAKAQDSSRVIIFIIVLISTFASFFAVVLLLLTKKDYKSTETFHLIIAIAGMVLSWLLIHIIFTFRYAHIFYENDEEEPEIHAG